MWGVGNSPGVRHFGEILSKSNYLPRGRAWIKTGVGGGVPKECFEGPASKLQAFSLQALKVPEHSSTFYWSSQPLRPTQISKGGAAKICGHL